MKKLASTVAAAFLVSILAVGLSTTGAAEEETTNMTVDIAGTTQLDVRPSALDYTDEGEFGDEVEPGTNRTASDDGFEHVEISNIGSVEIEEIFAQGTMPDAQPFGNDSNSHDTGNFITLSTETATDGEYNENLEEEDTMHFLNRVEYEEDPYPTYIQIDEDEAGFNDYSVGRFRAGGVEYFYVLYAAEGDDLSDNDFILRIGDAPHTSTQLGTTDFRDDEASDESYTEYTQDDVVDDPGEDRYVRVEGHEFATFDTSGDADEAYEGQNLIDDDGDVEEPDDLDFEDLVDVQERNYNLYAYNDGSDSDNNHIIRTRFNTDQQSPLDGAENDRTTSSGQDAFLSSSDGLEPGDSFPVDVGVQVPQGVDQDGVESGSMTFFARDS